MAEESSEGLENSITQSTSSTPELLGVFPRQLYFPPPHNRDFSCTIKLENKSEDAVAFKVKTTAPKRYVVRPPQGACLAGHSVEVTVTLSVYKDPISVSAKNLDKFQILSYRVPLSKFADPSTPTSDEVKSLWEDPPRKGLSKAKILSNFTAPPKSAKSSEVELDHPPTPSVPIIEPNSSESSQSSLPRAPSKPQTSNAAQSTSFKNYVDPVATAPPKPGKGTGNAVIATATIIALVLGIILGMYLERML